MILISFFYPRLQEVFLRDENPKKDLDQTCHLIFTTLIASEQKRDIVFSEFVSLLKTTKVYRSIATAFANAELAQKDIYRGFFERILENKAIVAGLFLNNPSYWNSGADQRRSTISYVNVTMNHMSEGSSFDIANKLEATNYALPFPAFKNFQHFELSNGQKLAKIPDWGKYWTIGFQLKVNYLKEKECNLLYVYNGDDQTWVRLNRSLDTKILSLHSS